MKIDDFGWVLIVAIVLIVIAGLASTYLPGGLVTPVGENFTEIASFAVGGVGTSTSETSRSFSMGSFAVGEEQSEVVKEVKEFSVSRNMLSGEDTSFNVEVPGWLLEVMRSGELSFSIFETNSYGNLKVKWNGVVVLDKAVGTGGQRIALEKSMIKGSNKVEVSADGPGWLFWATTVYNIRSFKASVAYGPEKIFSYELAPSEIQNLDTLELTFTPSGQGSLAIRANGQQVYSAKPSGPTKVEFGLTDAPIRAGDNLLVFSSNTPLYVAGANLRVLVFGGRLEKERSFNITQQQFDLVNTGQRRGKIQVEVLAINRPGSLELTLNSNRLDTRDIKQGQNTVLFGVSDISVGENTLKLSGTGSYNIGTVSVGLAR